METGYQDIPGTYVQDGEHCRKGYHLNQCLMTLNKAHCRDAFRADEAGYLAGFKLTEPQRDAILKRQWLEMLRLGGNVYFTFKLAAFDGMTMQDLGAAMSREGMSGDEFRKMMLDGGRSIEGNRYVSEWEQN